MTSYVAVEVVDDLYTEDGALVLLESRLVRLGPVGAVILQTAAKPVTLMQLADALESAFGAPEGDLLTLTEEAVTTLTLEGLLVTTDG